MEFSGSCNDTCSISQSSLPVLGLSCLMDCGKPLISIADLYFCTFVEF